MDGEDGGVDRSGRRAVAAWERQTSEGRELDEVAGEKGEGMSMAERAGE
jgi:hypothetical protein